MVAYWFAWAVLGLFVASAQRTPVERLSAGILYVFCSAVAAAVVKVTS